MMIFKNKIFHGRLISLNEDASIGYKIVRFNWIVIFFEKKAKAMVFRNK